MTESITPRADQSPEIRYQPSMLSVPSAAGTVPPGSRSHAGAQGRLKRVFGRKLWFFAAIGVAGALGAQAIRDSAEVTPQIHHGSPGFRPSKSGKNQQWHRRALTIYVDDTVTQLGHDATDAVHRAFGHWVESHHHLPALTFDTTRGAAKPKQDGKSTVSYGPIDVPGHERDVAVTLTYSEAHSGEILEADIVLNSAYPLGVLRAVERNWRRDGSRHHAGGHGKSMHADEAEDCRDRYDVQNVLTHEVGHFFGLGEDMTEQGATMFKSIDECETHKRALASTDADAIRLLYTEPPDPEEAAAGPSACSVAFAPTSGLSGWSPLLLLGLLAHRRRR